MRDLRPGGGFDDLSRPEGRAFRKVKAMGSAAYPRLIRYVDNEDTMVGMAAVLVLNMLTARQEPLPKPATQHKIKADWEAWLKGAKQD